MKDFGTSLSPKSTRLRDSRYCPGRPASVPLRHTIASSAPATQHSHNGLTACRMRLHMASAGYGTFGPFATAAIRPRLRLPGTTRLVLRTSMAGSICRVITLQTSPSPFVKLKCNGTLCTGSTRMLRVLIILQLPRLKIETRRCE